MKKVILLSLLTTGHFAMADEVCQGLKIFTEYDSNNAVAVLTTENSQKLYVGSQHVVSTRVSTKIYYNLKDTKGNPVSIVTGYRDWLSQKSCGRALCDDVFAKTATVTAYGKTDVFVCQK